MVSKAESEAWSGLVSIKHNVNTLAGFNRADFV